MSVEVGMAMVEAVIGFHAFVLFAAGTGGVRRIYVSDRWVDVLGGAMLFSRIR
jgi:hypothetical protein